MNRIAILITAAAATGLILWAGVTKAGSKEDADIAFFFNAAFGSVGSIRNSADTKQFINCEVSASPSGSSLHCWARNKEGVFHSCSSTSAPLIAAAAGINGDSYLVFGYDDRGACTLISVRNGSEWAPKVL